MTVVEMIDELSKYPGDMQVVVFNKNAETFDSAVGEIDCVALNEDASPDFWDVCKDDRVCGCVGGSK